MSVTITNKKERFENVSSSRYLRFSCRNLNYHSVGTAAIVHFCFCFGLVFFSVFLLRVRVIVVTFYVLFF